MAAQNSMNNALILHGTSATPDAHWFQWLAVELEQLGYVTRVPQLPGADRPNFDRYWPTLEEFEFGAGTLLVGHSSGAVTGFRILERIHSKVELLISVGGFYRDDGFNCEELTSKPFEWETIKARAQRIILIASPDDPFIDMEQTNHLAQCLEIEPILMPGCGHFSTGHGGPRFTQFPELLSIITTNMDSEQTAL